MNSFLGVSQDVPEDDFSVVYSEQSLVWNMTGAKIRSVESVLHMPVHVKIAHESCAGASR